MNSSPSTVASGQEQDDFADQTMEELMAFVAVPSPPTEAYSYSDFDRTEYNGWVTNANASQRLVAVKQYNAEVQARAHMQARGPNNRRR